MPSSFLRTSRGVTREVMSPFPFGNWKNWDQNGEITDPKSGVRE